MAVIHKIDFVKKTISFLYILVCLSAIVVADDNTLSGNQPSGLMIDTTALQAPANDFYVESIVAEPTIIDAPTEEIKLAIPVKDEKDSTEVEPVLEPLVLAGSGAVAVGLGVGLAAIFGAPILFLVAALFLGAGAFLTAKGWRKIKDEPKKYKGEKIAIANYLVIGLVGIAASFYLLYWLFTI